MIGYEVIPPDDVNPVYSLKIEGGYLQGRYACPDSAIRAFYLKPEVLDRLVQLSRKEPKTSVITMEFMDKIIGEEIED